MNVFRLDKRSVLFLIGMLLLFPWEKSSAQPVTIQLDLVPLESINLGDLIVAEEIQNTTVYVTIRIQNNTGSTVDIQLRGIVLVNLPSPPDVLQEAGRFITEIIAVPPQGLTVLNTDFPNVIDIQDSRGEESVLEEIREIGRLAGEFQFAIEALEPPADLDAGNVLDSDLAFEPGELLITNPEQILRTGPADGSQEREENVVLSWTGDAGFDLFLLDVNTQEPGQTAEVALASNQPPIFSGSVGTATSVNLRDLALQRQVLPGMRIVWRVRGFVPGVGGGLEIPTDIGWFSIRDPNSALITATVNELLLLTQQLGLGDFASQLLSGDVTLTGEFVFADGTRVTYEELLSILNYLKANPDKVISVRIE